LVYHVLGNYIALRYANLVYPRKIHRANVVTGAQDQGSNAEGHRFQVQKLHLGEGLLGMVGSVFPTRQQRFDCFSPSPGRGIIH
jgi:hypothetical protein